MSLSKKRKMDSECRTFRERWTEKYFCVSMNGNALCLICSESVAALKECYVVRYYSSKQEKYKICVDVLRSEKVVAL
jgi:hypothetical protein